LKSFDENIFSLLLLTTSNMKIQIKLRRYNWLELTMKKNVIDWIEEMFTHSLTRKWTPPRKERGEREKKNNWMQSVSVYWIGTHFWTNQKNWIWFGFIAFLASLIICLTCFQRCLSTVSLLSKKDVKQSTSVCKNDDRCEMWV
jgi:hypothetical protein